ncbi:integrase core domain-containing protein [Streptomyces sp. NBC_01280]|uniref:integrase core domain-containing protein n=1 Tax=Streptomyces sp. NBC_01280 TaxID=2903810 RepID=UPI002E3661DB|nr:integrase core domain-containing protein [Streptomyces sp. NBC_01280]
MGLQQAAHHLGPAADPGRGEEVGDASGQGDQPLGASQNPGQTRPAQLPNRRLHGPGDSPHRGHRPGPTPPRPTWRKFLTSQADAVIACDFLHIDTAGLERLYALVCLEHGNRRLRIAGVTAHPTAAWATQQARNVACDLGIRLESLRFLVRDRDSKYTESYDAVFQAKDIETLKTPPRAPRTNAHCERGIGTLRREALDNILILNEAHTQRALTEYQRHYNQHRPDRARDQLPPHAHE